MKKAFNFRSAIVCVLVLIMCLTAFVACDKNKGDQGKTQGKTDSLEGLNKARDYVKQLYINNNEETAADYTVVSKVNIGGVTYPVTWTVTIKTEGASVDDVKVVAGESNVTIDVIDMADSDIEYTLTATVTDANGNTATVDFKRKVPKFHVATWAEYAEAADGKLLVVDGIVTMFNSKKDGASYNNMYIQDNDGAYYAYSMDEDPKDKNIAVGMKVRLTGTKKNYNGTYELEKVLIKEVLSTEIVTIEPADVTELLKNAESVKAKALTDLQGRMVTVKGAIAVEVDTDQKYCYFTVGGVKTYIRPSKSAGFLNDTEIKKFVEDFTKNKGHLIDVTGQAVVYNGAFYMQPTKADAVVYGAVADLTPAEQVKFVKENANALSDVTYSGYSVTLPSASDVFTDVKIAWTVDNTDVCTIADGKATFTYDYATAGRTVKLTATYTHATDTTVAPLTNEYTLELLIPQEVTVEQFLAKDVDNSVYKITGTIVAKQTDGTKNGAFVLADKTGAVFSYVKTTAELGSVVTVFATRTENGKTPYTIPQLGTKAVIAATDVEAVTPQVEETIDMANFDFATAKAENYVGKYLKITGISVKANEGKTDRIYLTVDGKNAVVHGFTEKEAFYGAYNERVGTGLIVYGYCRGLSSSYLSIQVANLEEKPLNDTEKVAQVKAGLSDLTTNKDFDLPTSKIATITWALQSGTGATLNGNHVTITQTDADQNVVFTATIVSGEVSDTKDITVTIKAKDNRVAGVKGVEGVAYKLVMNQTKANKVVYLLGSMSGFYIATTEKAEDGIDVYVEIVSENSYCLYSTIEGKKQYIEMIVSGTHLNAEFHETASMTWSWNDTLNTYTAVLDGEECVLGTRNDNTYTTVGACEVSKNPFVCQLYGQPAPAPVKTNQELVDEAAEALKKDFTITAKSSGATIDLAAVGINNATIVWTSSDNAVIAIGALTDGKYVATVNDPTTDAMTVTLTAVLTVGEGEEAKTANCAFPITVTRTLADVVVSLGEITGGTVEVFVGENKQTLPVTLKQEQVITLNPVATEGYELVKVFVNGTELAKGTDGAYTYPLGATNAQITATFRKITFVKVSVEETIANGSVTVKVGDVAVEADKQYRDGTVLTITATPASDDYKLVEIKVNGTAITGTTYTIAETDTEVVITATFAEKYPAMSIADFKASETAKGTQVKLTGVVTSVDKKAAYFQDKNGQAVYVFFGYVAPYSDTLKNIVIGKEYTFAGEKDDYYGLVQLKSPVVIGEAKDPEYQVTAKEVDETAYNALTLANTAELLTLRNLVVTNGKWMLGETEVKYYAGNANDANKKAVDEKIALLANGVKFDLVGVNFTYNKPKNADGFFQVAVDRAEVVVIDWQPVATVDLKEIVVNGTAKITVTANPAVTTDVKATFATENDKIATVDANGVVTGVAVGTVGINVTANGHTVKVEVTVVAVAQEFTVNYTKTVDGANGSIASVMADATAVEPGMKVVKGTKVTVTVTPAEGYQLASYTLNAGEAVAANGQTSFDVTVTEDVTIAVTFEVKPAAKTWQKVTDASSLAVGDTITLVYETKTMEMSGVKTTSNGGYVTNVLYTGLPTGAFAVTLENGAGEGTFALKTADGKYLSSDNGNNLYAKETTVTDATSWTVSFDEKGNVVITNVSTSRIIRYNTGSPRFAAYKSDSSVNTPIQLYKLA